MAASGSRTIALSTRRARPLSSIFTGLLAQHNSYATATRSTPSNPATRSHSGRTKEKLVVLGCGWAGFELMRRADKEKYDTYVVAPNTYWTMTPLLASAATGSLEFRNVVEPIRESARPGVFYYHAWCDSIDFAEKTVNLTPAYPPAFQSPDPTFGGSQAGEDNSTIPNTRSGPQIEADRVPHRQAIEGSEAAKGDTARTHSHKPNESYQSQEQGRSYALPYDKLVICTGTYNRTFGTPGVQENAWFLKDVQNARAIRYRVMECFEQAEHPHLTEEQRRNLLSFIVVGGGPTGSEMASSLFDMVHNDIKRVFPELVKLCSITIVDAAGSILNTFDESLQKYARERFIRDGIQLKMDRKPIRVERGKLVVEPDGEMPFGLLVWSTGNTQGPLVTAITNIKKDKTGALLTNEQLQVVPADDAQAEVLQGVYAMGDCAQIDEHALPATAQVAAQKGIFLSKLLNEQTAPAESFKYTHRGSLANLSSGRGIAQFSHGKFAGRSASALWHSTYSLYMSVSWKNKIAIPFTWILNRIFGRTLSRI